MNRHFSTLLLTLSLAPASLDAQSATPDYETARRAVLRGEMLPLERILTLVEADHPGQIVEVELENEDGIWLYEVEVLTPAGHLIEIDLDARTGEILGYEEEDD
ncbi:PepSY domain-containing protein [Paracoccus nototheniae]|uniref:PepSY domain-containing protein n=1 Tax=Paracoccus nototheniae TaxID=2489002 RepID=A0ABW4E139_9RHOB|nr:PepSY domain-containing protein [Paracoccus nototheniae]